MDWIVPNERFEPKVKHMYTYMLFTRKAHP